MDRRRVLVKQIYTTKPVVTYKLTECNGTPIKGKFYESDIQKVVLPDDALFRIDQVLKRKGNQVFVSWKGWPKEYNGWMRKKDFASAMKEFRITLISDPTDEYPHNKNNSFKVRLPDRLNLEGNQWQASLWSMSVADVGHSPTVINTNNDATLLKYRYTFTSRYQDSNTDILFQQYAKAFSKN